MKKGVEQSLKSKAVDDIIDKINVELKKPHRVVDRWEIINPFIEELEHILRHLNCDIRCCCNQFYEGFIFVTWLENDQLFTKVIKL